MKAATSFALGLLLCSGVCVGNQTNTIGNLLYNVPVGWSTKPQPPVANVLPTVMLKNGTDVLMVTLISSTATSLNSLEDLDRFLNAQAKPIEAESLEGKTTPLHFKTHTSRMKSNP